jgi:hypothetical protein
LRQQPEQEWRQEQQAELLLPFWSVEEEALGVAAPRLPIIWIRKLPHVGKLYLRMIDWGSTPRRDH